MDDIKAVHVWGRNTLKAGQKWEGDPEQLSALKDAGLVLTYHGTGAELQSLANNCNLTKRGPNAAFDAALSQTLAKVAEEAGTAIVMVDDTPGEGE